MAKKFDLAALMGEAVSKSNTGEMRVEQIPLAEIEENENNSYAQTGIDELAESIKVIGLQQPLFPLGQPRIFFQGALRPMGVIIFEQIGRAGLLLPPKPLYFSVQREYGFSFG